MTKERLKLYSALRLEVAQLEQTLSEHLNSSYMGPATLDGMPKGGELSDITAKLAMETIKLYAELNAKRLEALRLCREIEDCIEALGPVERTLMRERYILGKEWVEVCVRLNYSWRQAHRVHSRILAKLA